MYTNYRLLDGEGRRVASDEQLIVDVRRAMIDADAVSILRLVGDIVTAAGESLASIESYDFRSGLAYELWGCGSVDCCGRHGGSLRPEDLPEPERSRRLLADAVGGPVALATLDGDALPDEPFDWTGVDDDIRERVAAVAALCDRCCEALFDVEYRTATRRLLARVARHGSASFRKKTKDEQTAAALCTVTARTNRALQPEGPMAVADVLRHFEIKSSVAYKASSLLSDAGFSVGYGEVAVRSPRYLVSRRRREIIDLRDNP